MKTIYVEKLNEAFGGNDVGEEIGYGDRSYKFYEADCYSLLDFLENAEPGKYWIPDDGVTYYKIRNANYDAVAFYLNEQGDIIII